MTVEYHHKPMTSLDNVACRSQDCDQVTKLDSYVSFNYITILQNSVILVFKSAFSTTGSIIWFFKFKHGGILLTDFACNIVFERDHKNLVTSNSEKCAKNSSHTCRSTV